MANDPIPRNLAVTLRYLRLSSRYSLRRMSDELNATPGRKVGGKSPGRVAKFDHDLIEALENQERLKVWHLGRYANWFGMPPGAIILFSQLASHLRDAELEDIELTKSIAEAVKQVCEFVIANAEQLVEGALDRNGTPEARDRKLETLVRECAYKNADAEQKLEDARLIFALFQIMNRYAPEAKKLYRNHSRKKFAAADPDDSEVRGP